MVTPEQNPETAPNPLVELEADDSRFTLRTKILTVMAGLALIGSAVYITESYAPDHKAYVEITSSNNSTAVAADFAAQPTWTQDFGKMKNGSLNPKYWVYDIGTGGSSNPGWGNNEAEYYTDNSGNVQVKDGLLNIVALQQKYQESDYTSARIKTENRIDFEYGDINVVAKLPAAVGTWPAIWMLSENNKYYYRSGQSDPLRYLNPGEIDIMEETGSEPNVVTSSAQSRKYNPTDHTERVKEDTVKTAYTAFHDYGLEWTPTQLVFTVDGKPYHIVNKEPGNTYKAWPYDQPYFLLINDALGGSEGGQDVSQYPPNGIDNAALPADFQIKSITYSKYIGPGTN